LNKNRERKRDLAYLSADTNPMFARLILLIAIFAGLTTGPASLGASCEIGLVAKACDCCVAPAKTTCCNAPSVPVQRVPISSGNSSQGQLKLAIQPLVVLLPLRFCVSPSSVEVPPRKPDQLPVSPLVDRICIRLI